MMGSMTTVQELLQGEIHEWSEINTMSDPSDEDAANESGDDSDDSTPRHETNKDKSFYIRDLFTTMEMDPHRDGTEDDGIASSRKIDPHNTTLTKLGPFARTCNPSKWEADI